MLEKLNQKQSKCLLALTLFLSLFIGTNAMANVLVMKDGTILNLHVKSLSGGVYTVVGHDGLEREIPSSKVREVRNEEAVTLNSNSFSLSITPDFQGTTDALDRINATYSNEHSFVEALWGYAQRGENTNYAYGLRVGQRFGSFSSDAPILVGIGGERSTRRTSTGSVDDNMVEFFAGSELKFGSVAFLRGDISLQKRWLGGGAQEQVMVPRIFFGRSF
ncbi:MAG: hypothetical protein QNL04_06625 [SAR324 cluster bacterium]|nr:hypothetical protein [SAR324 cluster bacterium]